MSQNLTGGEDETSKLMERFGHMLKPITSAAGNWNIDLTEELNKYHNDFIQELLDIDFAGAGLMLQASGHIYCRKVDYLLRMIYDVLPSFQLTSSNKKKLQTLRGEDGGDEGAGVDDDDAAGPTGGARGGRRGGRQQLSDELTDLSWLRGTGTANNLYYPSQGPVDLNLCLQKHYKPQMPMSLLPLENYEKSDVPLWPKRGEATGRKDDFLVNNCVLHETGTLLLQSDNARLIGHIDADAMGPLPDFAVPSVDVPRPIYVPDDMAGTSHGAHQMQDDDDDGMDYGGAEPDDDDFAAPDAGPATTEADGTIAARPRATESLMDVTVARGAQRANNRKRTEIADLMCELDDEPDLAELDTVAVQKPVRPLRTSNSTRPTSKQKTKRLNQRLEMSHCNKQEYDTYGTTSAVTSYVNTEFFSAKSKIQKRRLQNVVYNGVEKFTIKKSKLAQELVRLWIKDEVLDEADYNRIQQQQQIQGSLFQAYGDDDDGGDYGAADYVDDDDDYEAGGAAPLIAVDDAVDQQLAAANTEHLLYDATNGTAPAPVCRTYEELLIWHLEQHVRKCGLSAKQTELSRRVSEWHEEVMRRLDADDSRKPFRVHDYAQHVVDRLHESDRQHTAVDAQAHPFANVFAGYERRELCRYFLSSLFLANRHVVHLSCPDETQTNAMLLTALTDGSVPVDLGVEA